MMDRHTKMNAKVLLIWVLILAAIWLLYGCKCGKNIGRSEARTDSTAQSEQTTIIEVLANNTDAINKPTANNVRGKMKAQRLKEASVGDLPRSGLLSRRLPIKSALMLLPTLLRTAAVW